MSDHRASRGSPFPPSSTAVSAAAWYPSIGRYTSIDHLRGAAALSVVLFHSFGSVSGQPVWPPLEPIRQIALHGWLGVHVFFAVSGFCIAEKLAALARQHRGVDAFLRDRFWRILPPYWATLVFAVLLNLTASPFNHVPLSQALPPSAGAALADITLTQTWFGTESLLLVSWTLSCEFAFYLLAAGAFALRQHIGPALLLGGGGMLAVAGLWLPSSATGIVGSLWPDFWIGVFVHHCLSRRRRWAAALGFVLFVSLAWAQSDAHLLPMRLVAAGTAAVLFVAHPFDAQISSWRAIRWLGAIGVWSYSLYLIHAPILSRVVNLGRRSIAPTSPTFVGLIAGALALALGTAWLFHRFVERPLEIRRRRPSSPSLATA